MNIDDICISTGVTDLDDCKNCNGLQYECIGYIPKIQGEMYEATRIDRTMEFYQRLKDKIKRLL